MKSKQELKKYIKRQEEWDTVFVVTNRCLDVAIMFFSVFAFIYLVNGNYMTGLIYLIIDMITIPINNGKQAFEWVHIKIHNLRNPERKPHNVTGEE